MSVSVLCGVGSALRGRNFHDSGNAVTNDLGEFRIPDLRGRYTITVNPPPQGFRAPQAKEKAKVNRRSDLYHHLLFRHVILMSSPYKARSYKSPELNRFERQVCSSARAMAAQPAFKLQSTEEQPCRLVVLVGNLEKYWVGMPASP